MASKSVFPPLQDFELSICSDDRYAYAARDIILNDEIIVGFIQKQSRTLTHLELGNLRLTQGGWERMLAALGNIHADCRLDIENLMQHISMFEHQPDLLYPSGLFLSGTKSKTFTHQ